ncbi:MAG: hypothetical protein ACMG6E_03630, partial [Candidatus Roizmanbacteria bacterium]
MLQRILKIYSSVSRFLFILVLIVGTFTLLIKSFTYISKSSQVQLPSYEQVKAKQTAQLELLFNDPRYNADYQIAFKDFARSSLCSLTGDLCHKNIPSTLSDNYNSVLGKMIGFIAYPIANPPSSGIASVKMTLAQAGLITKAQAAEGIGFASIKNYAAIWKALRDIVFLALVMILIGIGFMIMFRFKINPQTVASIENSLPKIILSMIYISFSFAIAGFLIDVMYLMIFFIFEVTANLLPHASIGDLQNQYLLGNLLNLTPIIGMKEMYIHTKALIGLFDLLPTSMQFVLGIAGIFIQSILIRRLTASIGGRWALLLGNCGIDLPIHLELCTIVVNIVAFLLAGKLVPIVLWIVVLLVVVIGYIYLMARILALVIGAYVQIIISIIFSPFFILVEAVPGKSGFFPWIKRLFGYLLVFPTLISLLLVLRFINTVGLVSGPPLALPLLFNFNSDALVAIISGVFLYMIPDLTKNVVKKVAGDT